jgi:hypothetical protein
MKVRKELLMILLGLMILSLSASAVIAQDPYNWDSEFQDAQWAWLGLTGFLCVIPILWLIIAVLIGIWVYRDAEKRGSSGILWLIIVFVTGIIGLIIWLIVRPPVGGKKTSPAQAASDRRCPECGRAIPEDAKVCPYCGKKFGE